MTETLITIGYIWVGLLIGNTLCNGIDWIRENWIREKKMDEYQALVEGGKLIERKYERIN